VPSSMTRMMLVIPVIVAFIERLGLGERGRNGLIVATVLSSYYLGSGILTANVPNMALTGSVERNLHIHLHFADYLFTYFPMLGLLKTAVAGFLIAVVFRDRIVKSPPKEADAAKVRLTRQGWLVVIVLGIALLLWITDFLHGIAPAWVALVAAIIFMFPGVDIVPLDQFGKLVNLRPLIYVGGILGLGAFIAASGLGVWIAHYLVAAVGLENHGGTKETVLLSLLAAFVGLLATHGGMAALMPSLARELATASGLSVDAVIGTIVIGYSVLLLPYQVPPAVVGYQMAGTSHRVATWSTLWIGLVTAAISVPCQLLWMHVMGRG
jgi:Sodium:sulfate symporter transmembrane region